MTPSTKYTKVAAGPDGAAYIQLTATRRQRPHRYRIEHLGLAFLAGAVSTVLAVVAMMGAVLP